MRFLQACLANAKNGSEGALTMLRTIVRKASDDAPADDLIRMAQLLYDIRHEAAREHIDKN
jgi:hypothetical protein